MRPTTGITLFGVRLGIIFLAVYWIMLFLGTHWPAGVQIATDISDKTKHFNAFLVLTLLCCYVSTSTPLGSGTNLRRFGSIIFVLMIYAALDEYTQKFSPGRYPDVWDFVADTAGILTAIMIYVAGKRLLGKPKA